MTGRVALGVVAAALLAAAPADATLVYTKNLGSPRFSPSVWTAGDDGSAPRRLATGHAPRLSPDGTTVLLSADETRGHSALLSVPVTGGVPRKLLDGVTYDYVTQWSSDGRHVLTFIAPPVGAGRLAVIDVATGAQVTLTRGNLVGASFSPDGSRVVFGRTLGSSFDRADLYVVPAAGGTPQRISTNHRSLYPLWGPGDRIVFTHVTPRRHDAPRYELYVTDPQGASPRRLTHTRVRSLVSGLTPTEFSADGTRLLAEFGGQDTSYAVAVNAVTGAQRALTRNPESGFTGSAISKDGTKVLGATGGYDPQNRGNVVTVPFGGGRPTVLVRNADEPDWDR